MTKPQHIASVAGVCVLFAVLALPVSAEPLLASLTPADGTPARPSVLSMEGGVLRPVDITGSRLARLALMPLAMAEIEKQRDTDVRTKFEAGGDDLRPLLTLPGAAVPNNITPRPLSISRTLSFGFQPPNLLTIDLRQMPAVRKPHLWAGVGTVLGGMANARLAGYRLSEFRLGFNSWESEKIALREQGADMVQHFILGYGLTRYFLESGHSPINAGLSAFTYEFIAGEVFESFPQAGGISARDVAIDVLAVAVGMIDAERDSRLRFWASSEITVKPSAPNEFDPYRIGLGISVGRIAGLELICAVENWKDIFPVHPDLDDPRESSQTYILERL